MKNLIFCFSGLVFFLLGCENSVDTENSIPIIESIIFNPTEIYSDNLVILNAIAVDDDGDSLIYNWSSTDGSCNTSGEMGILKAKV